VAIQKYDPLWNGLGYVWVSKTKVFEGSPTLIFSQDNYYVAYVSSAKGNKDIYVKKYDINLNLIDTKQLTNSSIDEDSPSLIALGDNFFMAYQSMATVLDSGGDIFLTRFDKNWIPIQTEQVTDQKSYQNNPSLTYAGDAFYLAYVSGEKGNMDVFLKKLDRNLSFIETKRLTNDLKDQDYPSLKWINGQFMLLYASNKTKNFDVYLNRYLRDWKLIDSKVIVADPGDQTASSMIFNAIDGMYWFAYSSKDATTQQIFVKPLKLSSPLKNCDIITDISATKAGNPFTMTIKFYNNYGELFDPTEISFGVSPLDAIRQGDRLQRVSAGTFVLKSVFGKPGTKTFRIGGNIDGCKYSREINVKAV
jgi:hypothetical protein